MKLKIKSLLDDSYIILIELVLLFISLYCKKIIVIILLGILLICIFKYNKFVFYILLIINLVVISHLLIEYKFYLNKIETLTKNNVIYDIYKIVDIKVNEDYQQLTVKKGKYKYIIYLYENNINKNYKIGNKLLVKGRFSLPLNEMLEGCFNYREYLYYKDIIGFFEIDSIKLVDNNRSINQIHYFLSKYFDNHFLDNSSLMLKTLIIGDKSGLSDDLSNNINNIGISHLFVVSGLHVSIIIMILDKILSILKVKKNSSSIITLFVLFFYLIITNYLISVIRVFLSRILQFLNKNEYLHTFNLFSINAIIVLLINPKIIYSYSFILTYLISGCIILSKDILKDKNNIIQMLIISLISLLVTLPIISKINGVINILSLVYNLFYIPLITYFILPFSILTTILPFLDTIYCFVITIFINIINFTSSIPIGNIILPKVNIIFIIIYYYILYKYLYNFEIRNKLLNKQFVLLILIIIIWNNINFFNTKKEINFLNLKIGESTLLKDSFNKLNILIDTGENNEIITYLRKKGIKRIDYLIISHSDSDHNGMTEELIKSFRVKNIIVSKYDTETLKLIDKKIKIIKLKKGDRLRVNSIFIDVLSPENNYLNTNDNSLVFTLTFNDFKILFMGDASINVENNIFDKVIDVDILKIGHHGSKYSTGYKLLKMVNFKYAVGMNGYKNTYGFPNKSVIDRIIEVKKENNLLNTIKYKTIIFEKKVFKRNFLLKNKKI